MFMMSNRSYREGVTSPETSRVSDAIWGAAMDELDHMWLLKSQPNDVMTSHRDSVITIRATYRHEINTNCMKHQVKLQAVRVVIVETWDLLGIDAVNSRGWSRHLHRYRHRVDTGYTSSFSWRKLQHKYLMERPDRPEDKWTPWSRINVYKTYDPCKKESFRELWI